MTTDQLQSIADNLMARGTAAMANGEREYARGLLDGRREIARLLPDKPAKATEPPVEAAEPAAAPVEPEERKKVLGVF